jgi:hypothetical protein
MIFQGGSSLRSIWPQLGLGGALRQTGLFPEAPCT